MDKCLGVVQMYRYTDVQLCNLYKNWLELYLAIGFGQASNLVNEQDFILFNCRPLEIFCTYMTSISKMNKVHCLSCCTYVYVAWVSCKIIHLFTHSSLDQQSVRTICLMIFKICRCWATESYSIQKKFSFILMWPHRQYAMDRV